MSYPILVLILLCAMLDGAGSAHAQAYPAKPIRIVTGSVSSNGNFVSRILAQGLSGSFGQQVIVDNRTSGIILGDAVARAPADGYTLLSTGASFWLAQFFSDNVPWDALRDFVPITLAASAPNLIVVHPSLPVKHVHGLIALARSRAAQLNYASGSTGSAPHLAAELFNYMARVNIVRINYKGAASALTDLMAGQVQLMFPNLGTVSQHVKSGRLRALAITSAQPSALFPGLPTVASSVLSGYHAEVLNGIFAPAKTPPAIVSKLNQEMVRILERADVKEKFFNTGVEAIGSTPEQLTAAVKSEMSLLGRLIRDLGIRDE